MFRILTLAAVGAGLFLPGCGGNPSPFRPAPPPAGLPGEARIPYGRQGEEDVTGAMSSVPMGEKDSYHTVVEMLRSHVPGLQVTELADGVIRLRIRGPQQSLRTDEASNQPLLVIDGMPVMASAIGISLRGIVPHQIQSIHVLKDVASTSIYGSQGANGVILIYTKR